MAPAAGSAEPSASGTRGTLAALAAAAVAGVAAGTGVAHGDSSGVGGSGHIWVKRTPGAVPRRSDGPSDEDEDEDEDQDEDGQKQGGDGGNDGAVATEAAAAAEARAAPTESPTPKLVRTSSAAFADGPFFTRAEVEAHYEWDPESAGPEQRVWVTYNRGVYDITDFLKHHPGGHERIMGAAGGDVAPFWQQYQQHYAPHVYAQLAELRIGTLAPGEEAVKISASDDPYVAEPSRVESLASAALKVKPYNAESPSLTMLDGDGGVGEEGKGKGKGKQEIPRVSFLTPNELWYVRHHHPVPVVDPAEYRLELSMHAAAQAAPSLEEQRELAVRDASDVTGFPVKTYVHESGPGEAAKVRCLFLSLLLLLLPPLFPLSPFPFSLSPPLPPFAPFCPLLSLFVPGLPRGRQLHV